MAVYLLIVSILLLFPSGGPFIMKTDEDRLLVVGTLHGGLERGCSNNFDLPTIFTRIDSDSILKFIRKIVFNQEVEKVEGNCQSTTLSIYKKEPSNIVDGSFDGEHVKFNIKGKLKKRNAIIIVVIVVLIFAGIAGLCIRNQCLLKKKR